METEKYRALLTAIETGSLAAAAEKLGYTTSGISRMMASLESETGMTLLNRSKNGVQASSACEKILPEIRTLLHSAEALNEKSASLHGRISGTVRIGTAYNYYFPALSGAIRQFSSQYPDVSVELTGGFSTGLTWQLEEHQLDLCIVSRRENAGKWIPLCKDEMVAAVSSKSPLARRKSFPISGFTVNPYIQTHPDVDSDSSRVFSKYGVIPDTRYTTEDSMATFSMVAADLGITLNNAINTRLWKENDIVFLPLRPRQIIEIGIEVSNEADNAALHFIDAFLKYSPEKESAPE